MGMRDLPATSPSTGTVLEKAGQDQPTADMNNKDKGTTITAQEVADQEGQRTSIKSKTEDAETHKGSAATLAIPNPKLLMLPPEALPLLSESDTNPQTLAAPPLTLLGFVDKNNSSSSSTCEKSSDKSEAVKGAGTTSSNDTEGTEHTSSSPDPWYPSMMDRNDYDFRDRRLDY